MTMNVGFLRRIQESGWEIVRVRPDSVRARCRVPGCGLHVSLAPDQPLPCAAGRIEGQRAQAFDTYDPIRKALVARRMQIGLSQNEIDEAAGFTRGHIGKLEAEGYDKTPSLSTLVTWAATLGLNVSLAEAPLPARTLQFLVQKRHEVERSVQNAANARSRGGQGQP